MSRIFKILIIFSALLIATPALAVIDLSLDSSSISFSKDSALEGEVVRVFTRVFNIGEKDVYGFVRFLGNAKEIGDPQPISVKINTYDDVFIDWTTQAGTYNISAEIINTNPTDSNNENNSAMHTNYFVDLDTDKDEIGNTQDNDDDNDSVLDNLDAFPLNPNESQDTDKDGIGNNADTDDDNDGLTDAQEQNMGTDALKFDTDADGVSDKDDVFPLDIAEWLDNDNDEIGDNADEDDDNDGLLDSEEQELGTDPLNSDSDNDGLSDKDEIDQNLDPLNPDTDNDSALDSEDAFPLDNSESQDSDNDGIGNNTDINNEDKAPTVVLGYKIENDNIILDAKNSIDEDGEIIEYKWELGDGQVLTGKKIEYEYEEPGEYTLVLSVTDNVGQVSISETDIKITKPVSNIYIILGIIILAVILVACVVILSRQKVMSNK